jgi:hypothetical protein
MTRTMTVISTSTAVTDVTTTSTNTVVSLDTIKRTTTSTVLAPPPPQFVPISDQAGRFPDPALNRIKAKDSFEDCCKMCFERSDCTSFFFGVYNEQAGSCFLNQFSSTSAGRCVQSENPGFWTYDVVGDGSSVELTGGNGPCGYMYESPDNSYS